MNSICLSVAGLQLWLDGKGSNISFTLSKCHQKFTLNRPPKGGLYLNLQNSKPQIKSNWHPLYNSSENWELWEDQGGKLIFVVPDISPPKRNIVIDPDFTNGKVIGDFIRIGDNNCIQYPLHNIEIKLFINWLANYGDLMLHAAAVKVNNEGYCFLGASGAGKSTLASVLVDFPGFEILGEDNVILRYKDDRFLIYGTPWHLNSKMCSANSAPLKKIYFLDRTGFPGVSNCTHLQGVANILRTAFIPYYRPETLPNILDRLDLLANQVPFGLAHYELGSDPRILFS